MTLSSDPRVLRQEKVELPRYFAVVRTGDTMVLCRLAELVEGLQPREDRCDERDHPAGHDERRGRIDIDVGEDAGRDHCRGEDGEAADDLP
jgi:hypothetical protein